jgi:hypothetical protein
MPPEEVKTFDVKAPNEDFQSVLTFSSDEMFQRWLDRAGWRALVLLKDAGKRCRTEFVHLDQVISGETYVPANLNTVRTTVRFASVAASLWSLV